MHAGDIECRLESQQAFGIARRTQPQRGLHGAVCGQGRRAVEACVEPVVGIDDAVEQAAGVARGVRSNVRVALEHGAAPAVPCKCRGGRAAGETRADDDGVLRRRADRTAPRRRAPRHKGRRIARQGDARLGIVSRLGRNEEPGTHQACPQHPRGLRSGERGTRGSEAPEGLAESRRHDFGISVRR